MSHSYQDESGTNRNLLGITDRQALHKIEYEFTAVRGRQLAENPIPGAYDMEHLKAIHRHLFQDVYGWAGQQRTVNFSKMVESRPGWKAVFARTEEIGVIVDQVAQEVAARNTFKGLDKPAFVEAMADVYVRLNRAHPFPEGNGRSTQTLLSQLAKEAGHELDFGRVHKDEWNRAAALAVGLAHRMEPGLKAPPDMQPIRQVFGKITDPVREQDRAQDRTRDRGPER